ncbi:hypothetical protein WLZ34_05545 [Thermogladius sp. KZ2Tp1]|uniref:hypothetical protein n=1 Tax=Thermogladius sp. KZ2Tp1 TaxID=3136289 RepID=UPI003DA8D1AB
MSFLEPRERREYLELIVQAGLEEDFIEWLRLQGITHIIGRFDNIPLELIKAYIAEKKLEVDAEAHEDIHETGEEDRRFIPAKERSRRFYVSRE